MKPRIFKHAGLWYCCSTAHWLKLYVEGLGYNPAHAYADWKHARDRLRNAGVA